MDQEQLTLLSLVVSFGLQDVEDIRGRKKGKAISGPPSDEEIALQMFYDEARALQSLLDDASFACSIDEALRTDAEILEEYIHLEEVAIRDREIAQAISEGRPLPRQPPLLLKAPSVRTLASTTSTTSLALSAKSSLSTALTTKQASSSARQLPSGTPVKLENCVICTDPIRGPVIRAPCGDTYDVNCIVDLFRSATVDESLFPPACCRQPFDVLVIRQYLTKDLANLFDKKSIEFKTKDRVYCHRPTCSAFLGAATQAAYRMACQACWFETCGHCKAAAHAVHLRCTSTEDEGVVALAEQEGWKRCPGCGHLVELSFGCYHMTCRCRHEFCYLCTKQWKTCRCTQWDEDRLLLEAQDRVQRERRVQAIRAPNAPAPRVDTARAVREQVARLRDNHECEHRWRYVASPGNCEQCGHYLSIFLFNCKDCYRWSCARCRRNRWIV